MKPEALAEEEEEEEAPGEVCVEKRDLSSCGLLYPALMKQRQPLTRSAIIEQEERSEEANEVVETFQGEEVTGLTSLELLSCCCRRVGVSAGREFDERNQDSRDSADDL